MDYKRFGKAIRQKRKDMKLTQEKLAELADLSTAFVGHIERGTRIASINTVCKLADALDCSIDELVGRAPNWPEIDERAYEIIQIINRIAREG